MLIIIYIGLLCMPLHVVAYYPRSLFHVMFDNLTKLDTMGLFDDDEETSTTTDDPLTTNQTDETFEELLREPITMNGDLNTLMEVFRTPLGNGELYLNHFNELNLDVYNFTRKRMQAEVGFDQQRYYDLDEPRNLTPARENEKIDKIRMLGLEFLILTRYKIASAMSQRIKVVKDKRYQIGYLFCRLRRIRTEMLKLIVMASEQFKSWWQKRIVTLMRIYQEIRETFYSNREKMADMLFHIYYFAVMTTVLYVSSCASKRARGIPKRHIRVLDDIISTYIDFSSIYQNSTVDLILGGNVQNPDFIMDNQDINTLDHKALKNIIEVTKNRITNDNDRLLNNTRKFRHETDIVKVLGYPHVRYEAAYAIGKSFEMMKQSIYATKFRLTETNELRRKYRLDPVFNMALLAGNIHQIVMKCDNLMGQMQNLPVNTHFIHFLVMYEKILAGNIDIVYLTQRAFLYDKLAQQLIKGEDEEGEEKRERPRRKPKGFSKAYGAPKDDKPEPVGGIPEVYKGNEQYAQRPRETTKTTRKPP